MQVSEASSNCSSRYFSTSVVVTPGESRETKRDFARTLFCNTESHEELLTPNFGILGFLTAQIIAVGFQGDDDDDGGDSGSGSGGRRTRIS
jgi:hypothetical protein